MSTRATYKFEGEGYRPAVTYYIHCDGYPEGAAGAFLAGAVFGNLHGGQAENFLRANDRAEFTGGHESHVDTEYRYTVTMKGHLCAEKRMNLGTSQWSGIFTGELRDFIKRYEGTQLIKYRGRYLTRELAGTRMLEILTELKRAMQHGWTGNASSIATDVWNLNQHMLKGFGADEFTDLVARTVEEADRAHCLAYGWNKDCSDEEAYQKWVKTFRDTAQE